MKRALSLGGCLAALVACTGAPEPADCPECTECPSDALEEWEAALLAPDLASLREGVHPYSAQGWGVCSGEKKCEEHMGTAVGELAEGDYIIHSELAVPKLGEGWQVRFDLSCDIQGKNGGNTEYNHDKTYGVIHAGKERGYRLTPLWKIQSPHPQGARDCTYSLTPIRPDGGEGTPMTGSYSTPMPEK